MQELTSHCPTPDTFNADGTKQAVDQGIEDGERVRKYEELCILCRKLPIWVIQF